MGRFYFHLLKWFGWKIDPTTPDGVKKAVVVMGPHTSNWDFIIGRMAFSHYKVKSKFLIKKELFFFPFGYVLKALGGVPVDRKKNNNLVDFASSYFNENDECFMVFTPEGTRSYSPNWKKGFYFIAQKANVPIYIGYIDYKKKTGGFYGRFEISGDIEKDVKEIKKILSNYSGRFPEKGIRAED
jgi:1-acyl-sn-glycerol-3-phosphate acyltransferase